MFEVVTPSDPFRSRLGIETVNLSSSLLAGLKRGNYEVASEAHGVHNSPYLAMLLCGIVNCNQVRTYGVQSYID